MPAKSKAQVRKLASLRQQGKMSGSTFQEWLQGVDTKRLPERVRPKKGKRA